MSGAAGHPPPHRQHSVLHGMLVLSAPWLGRWRTRGIVLLLLSLTGTQVALAVGYNLWNARLFDALERRDTAALLREAWVFAALLAGIVVSNAGQVWAKRAVALSWRRALTERLLGAWLAEGQQWRLAQIPGSPDNPDGRIAEDIRIATEQAVELVASLFFSATVLVAFVGILWSLSGMVEILGLPVPGHLVLLAVLYAALGGAAAFVLGRPLTASTEQRQRAEADLRYGLARAREHDEGVALARGEALARGDLLARFAAVASTWRRQTAALRNLTGFQSTFTTVAPILPLLVAAPRYLAGGITLGGLMQIAQGFQQTVVALSWPVDNAARIAEFSASAERILALADAVEAARGDHPDILAEEDGEALACTALTLRLPDGSALAAPFALDLPRGARAEVAGDPRAVRALFLAIAGLWPWGEGVVRRPRGAHVAVLPGHPWLPEGTLSRLLTPPGGAPREAMVAVLEGVGLAALALRLDEAADWETTLDAPDGLRLGFARLLMERPDVVLLADMTAALGPEEVRRLVGLLARALPQTIVLAADHGSLDCETQLVLAPPAGLPQGRTARAAARRRESRLVALLLRGFGHRQDP
jgi:putative ATP-binding cassette transporter